MLRFAPRISWRRFHPPLYHSCLTKLVIWQQRPQPMRCRCTADTAADDANSNEWFGRSCLAMSRNSGQQKDQQKSEGSRRGQSTSGRQAAGDACTHRWAEDDTSSAKCPQLVHSCACVATRALVTGSSGELASSSSLVRVELGADHSRAPSHVVGRRGHEKTRAREDREGGTKRKKGGTGDELFITPVCAMLPLFPSFLSLHPCPLLLCRFFICGSGSWRKPSSRSIHPRPSASSLTSTLQRIPPPPQRVITRDTLVTLARLLASSRLTVDLLSVHPLAGRPPIARPHADPSERCGALTRLSTTRRLQSRARSLSRTPCTQAELAHARSSVSP